MRPDSAVSMAATDRSALKEEVCGGFMSGRQAKEVSRAGYDKGEIDGEAPCSQRVRR
jgi:hypothetical protein